MKLSRLFRRPAVEPLTHIRGLVKKALSLGGLYVLDLFLSEPKGMEGQTVSVTVWPTGKSQGTGLWQTVGKGICGILSREKTAKAGTTVQADVDLPEEVCQKIKKLFNPIPGPEQTGSEEQLQLRLTLEKTWDDPEMYEVRKVTVSDSADEREREERVIN